MKFQGKSLAAAVLVLFAAALGACTVSDMEGPPPGGGGAVSQPSGGGAAAPASPGGAPGTAPSSGSTAN